MLFNDVTSQGRKEARCTPQKYSVGILMAKKLGHEADHLPLYDVEVKSEWS